MALTKVTGSVIKDSVSLSGNVSVGGTLTYQDVTNVDALGIGTFRTGIKVLAGQVDVGSNIKLGNAGVITATSFSGVMSGTTGSFSGQVNVGSNIKLGTAGVITATSFSGSGANLTSLPAQATIANNADNRVITGGSGVNLNGEANLTFDGTNLKIGNAGTDGVLRIRGAANSTQVSISDNTSATLRIKTASGALGQIFVESGQNLVLGTDNTERLRIDSSGTLLVGATSYGGGGNDPALYVSTSSLQGVKFHKTGSGQSSLQLTCDSGTGTGQGNNAGLQLTQEGTSSYITNHDSGNVYYMMGGTNTILHRSNGTSRQRQANGGGTNTATYNESASWSSFSANNASNYDYKFINQNSSPGANYSVEICAAADVNNTTYRHINVTKNSSSSGIFVVFGNGNVQNANNSYGQTSDVKLKENIVDANSQWDDIKSLRVRNFNFKSDSGFSTHTQIGLIAQETEIVSAGLVENVNDVEEDENGTKTETGSVTKQVKYSVLYMKSVKALQEAQARIETLEAKVAALEGS